MADEETTEKEGYSKESYSLFTPKNIIIYLIVGGIIYALLYYFVIAKKGGYNYNSNSSSYTAPSALSPTSGNAMMAGKMTVLLSELNASGETGTAILSDENGKTKVVLSITGALAGASQPAHIHLGSCPTPGAVKYPLTNVIDGKSETVVDVSLENLKKQLPLAINVHKSQSEIKSYVACGDLK